MQISSTSPYQLTGTAATSSISTTQSEKTTETSSTEVMKEERNYGAFYDSWTDEAKEAYNAMVDQETAQDKPLLKGIRAHMMELTYTMRLAAKGQEIGPDTIDGIMAEAARIRENKDYPSLSTMKGFNTMLNEVIEASDVPGGNRENVDFYKTLLSMANSGYQSLDLEA